MLDGPSLEELLHALGDGGAEPFELVSRGSGDGSESTENVVHSVHEQHVKVNVQREVAPEPRHGFRVAAWFTEHQSRVGVAYEVTSEKERHRVARGKTTLVTTHRKKHGPGEDEMLFETPTVLVDRILGPRVAVEGANVPGA